MTDTKIPAAAVKKTRRASPKAAETAASPSEGRSLHELIGGDEAIVTAINKLTDKLFADPRINYVLFGVSRSDLGDKNRAFLTVLLDQGSDTAPGADLGETFSKLLDKGLKSSHIQLMLDHLRDALTEMELPSELADTLTKGAEEFHQKLFGK